MQPQLHRKYIGVLLLKCKTAISVLLHANTTTRVLLGKYGI